MEEVYKEKKNNTKKIVIIIISIILSISILIGLGFFVGKLMYPFKVMEEEKIVYIVKGEEAKTSFDVYNKKKQLVFNYDHTIYNIPLNKILYIEKVTGDKKCIIRCEGKKRYEVIAPLRFIISKLSEEFYQTHKSCIVNVKQIAQVDFAYGLITFKDGSQTDLLSVRCKRGLRKHVEKYN